VLHTLKGVVSASPGHPTGVAIRFVNPSRLESTHMTTQIALTGLVLYHPLIEIWSGTVRVHRDDDLAQAAEHLPPSTIVSDGRKRLVRKETLRTLLAIRKRVDRLLHSKGFTFMGGIAVPESRCQEIEDQLPKLEVEFAQALDVLCANLQKEQASLRDEFPEWADMLKRSELSEQVVRSRCSFRVVPLRVAPPDSSISASAAKRFDSIAGAALPVLLKDVAADAEVIYRDSFKGKSRVSAKTAAMVERLVEKLQAFSFLDPRVAPMSSALLANMQSIPSTGYLSIPETASVVMVLNTLSDPETLLEQGASFIPTVIDDSVLGLNQTDDLFDDSTGVAIQTPVVHAAPAARSAQQASPGYALNF